MHDPYGNSTSHSAAIPSVVRANPSVPVPASGSPEPPTGHRADQWTETLSPQLGEARRLLPTHVQRTDRIIALASVGNWPEISDEEIEVLAIGWWAEWQDDRERALHLPGRPDHLQRRLRDMYPSDWALANEAELRRSVQQFLRGPRRLDAIFEPELSTIRRLLDDPKKADRLLHNLGAMERLLRDCRLFHHALAGTWGDVLAARESTVE